MKKKNENKMRWRKFLVLQLVKLEKENEENKVHKFIWSIGRKNNFLRFYMV